MHLFGKSRYARTNAQARTRTDRIHADVIALDRCFRVHATLQLGKRYRHTYLT